jgi:hypothetical protein
MKNAKEKAEELVLKMQSQRYMPLGASIQCALITVDEIFEHIDYIFQELKKDKLPNKFDDEIEYWQEVKTEIEKL